MSTVLLEIKLVISKYESPQDTIYLGIASGDPDPDGTPDDYVGIITTKALLQTYITETGSTLQYKTTTDTVTGVQTSVTTGLSTAWNQENYSGGLSTTTSTKQYALRCWNSCNNIWISGH